MGIAEICRRLDGLPLAIELAAANLGTISVRELADRLAERLNISTTGAPSPQPGETSLRAVFDWSFGRLSESLRSVIIRLSAFRGSFSASGAHAVMPETAGWMARQLVAALAEQSLLITDAEAHEPRYRILETTRTFARELLDASGTAARVEQDHITYFARCAERAQIEYELLSDDEWLAPLNADRENFLAALERALGQSRDEAAGVLIAAGLADYWLTVGQEATAIRWLPAGNTFRLCFRPSLCGPRRLVPPGIPVRGRNCGWAHRASSIADIGRQPHAVPGSYRGRELHGIVSNT